MNNFSTFFLFCAFILSGCANSNGSITVDNDSTPIMARHTYLEKHPLVESAKKQIGVVTKYDTSYYNGGYPPEDRGACTDVIERALRDNDYNLKAKIDEDMERYPARYSHESDPNINYRRVKNVKIFLDNHAQKLPTCTEKICIDKGYWHAGSAFGS